MSLAHVHEYSLVSNLGGLVEVAVVEHDERALPAELQSDPLQVRLASGGEDELAHLARTGERHLMVMCRNVTEIAQVSKVITSSVTVM